jgi:hypothetical protein
MRKNECTDRPHSIFNSFTRDYHYRFPTTVSRIGIDRIHLRQVVPAGLHDARGVIVPLTDVVGAKVTVPSFGK